MKISAFKHFFKPLRLRERYMIARIQLITNADLLGWKRGRLNRELYKLRKVTWAQLRADGHPVDWEVSWWWQSDRLLNRMTADEATAFLIFQRQAFRPA